MPRTAPTSKVAATKPIRHRTPTANGKKLADLGFPLPESSSLQLRAYPLGASQPRLGQRMRDKVDRFSSDAPFGMLDLAGIGFELTPRRMRRGA